MSDEFGREIADDGSIQPFVQSVDNKLASAFRARRLEIGVPQGCVNIDLRESVKEANRGIDEMLSKVEVTFSDAAEKIEKIRTIDDGDFLGNLGLLREFSRDFYGVYYLGSGILSNFLGSELVIRGFRALAPYWNLIADVDAIEIFDELPDPLVLYRGGLGPVDMLSKGFSWTPDRHIADSFAAAPGSIVISTSVNRGDVLACFSSPPECIIDPENLVSVEIER